METTFTKTALKQTSRIDRKDARRIFAKIEEYAAKPNRFPQVTPVQGSEFLRLRVGDYRVIFEVRDNVMIVVAIGKRGEIYRSF
jgi:mRNA interferase RelE/StbE